MSHRPPTAEAQAVKERYERRAGGDWRYDRLNPAALWPAQERERAVARLLGRHAGPALRQWRVLEVGCGSGGNLLDLLRMGVPAQNLCGVELIEARHLAARAALPSGVRLIHADATALDLPAASQDLVMQFTVFSSLLDEAARQRLAERMWHWLKPGGAVLWYDFTFDNPRNPDVRGVPMRRVRSLFPQARIGHRRLTLAPPIARAVCRLHPALYTACNLLPMLRTHVLAWIAKP